ncbi:MAG TPA: hypothetical protein PKY82_21040 [Pyrinomonadaceae bacterium]|nr:hypothetical protein [Pyrinomonadaceae bacterium]
MKTEKTPVTATQEKYFLNTFPLINSIIFRKLNAFYTDYVEDIKQKVILSLWKWKLLRPEKELTEEEWGKLSNSSTNNEIKRFQKANMSQPTSLDEMTETGQGEVSAESLQTPSPVGNTRAEASSLLREVWKVIKKQSLREKFALLLQDREIINHLFLYECCDITEVAESLELSTDEFSKFYQRLPLSNTAIGLLLGQKLKKEIDGEQISKARQRIRKKLQPFQMRGQGTPTNERTSLAGENKTVSGRQTER